MKTTVVIPDALLAEVQAIAAQQNTTFRALVQEGLQHVVAKEKEVRKPEKLRDCTFPPKHLVTEQLKPRNWEELRAIIYEWHGE